ncbi:hypothetical protein BDU57DRAFT_455376 [Ampelomyces quisqualis]|uniref:Uncharacterized protein n=1 Tax=Ampelomyces quisqualis TaxID=50730 RepID=A0A6A5QEZ3_AMPQU|nr:hypothetical protein BDU57DRAFT_455376 [Ampelomyces quisqualis]
MILPRRNSNLVLVHHRKTGELEIRRTGEFSTIPKTPSTPLPRHLHYTNEDHRRVCRCPHSERHRKPSPVASESKYLVANLTRYLDQCHLEACSIADFRASEIQQQTHWASEGVLNDKFHYATRQKDVVCRCTRPNNHGRGRVRNPDIVELCVKFFRKNVDRMTCTKSQWRQIDVLSQDGSSSDSDSSKYESKSMQNILREREQLNYAAAPVTPHPRVVQLFSGPNEASDVPEQVWEATRPSMWSGRRGSATSCSTPLGTAASPRSLGTDAKSRPTLFISPPRASIATVWSDVQRDAAGQAPELLSENSERPLNGNRIDATALFNSMDVDGQDDSSGLMKPPDTKPAPRAKISNRAVIESRDSMFSALHPETIAERPATHCVELPTHRIPMELPTGVPQEYVELYGSLRASLKHPGKMSQDLAEESEILTFESKQASGRTYFVFRKLDDMFGLPGQEEFFLRYVTVCSQAYPSPPGDCRCCGNSLHDRRQRTFQIDSCKHFLHEKCLIEKFRLYDEAVGRCSICDTVLCERGLMDRIALDREAVFGSQFTILPNDVQIDFPQRSKAAHLQFEEDLAAAQLRLLKDYVVVHASDLYDEWSSGRIEPDWHGLYDECSSGRIEPDWHGKVVGPAVKLFKGWNMPSQKSQYFADRDAFLKLVAWAELVRLMNLSRVVLKDAHGADKSSFLVAELHRKFLWTKERYEREKKTWRAGKNGVLECDKIAQDAYNIAISTHLDAR